MNFSELKTELFARGTNYLEESAAEILRGERWLNEGYREILNLQAWPFLQADETGTSGAGFVGVPDLRKIRFVTDVSRDESSGVPGRPLTRATMDDLVNDDNDLSREGTPEYYYVANGGTEVRAYPLGGTIRVDYFRRVAPLSGTDTPIFDEEYHGIIVDKAMLSAYADSDNFEASTALAARIDTKLAAMAEDYQLDSREPTYIPPTGNDV